MIIIAMKNNLRNVRNNRSPAAFEPSMLAGTSNNYIDPNIFCGQCMLSTQTSKAVNTDCGFSYLS